VKDKLQKLLQRYKEEYHRKYAFVETLARYPFLIEPMFVDS